MKFDTVADANGAHNGNNIKTQNSPSSIENVASNCQKVSVFNQIINKDLFIKINSFLDNENQRWRCFYKRSNNAINTNQWC